MALSEAVPLSVIAQKTPDYDEFWQIANGTMHTVAESSQRTYIGVYKRWFQWSIEHGLSPCDLLFDNVKAYLIDRPVGYTTRSNELAILRKLVMIPAALVLHPRYPHYKMCYDTLQFLKTPREGLAGTERRKVALNPTQVEKVLHDWEGQGLVAARNRALLAVLFLVGVRRSEAAALRWSDIDLMEGVLTVRHGKGDKYREAAIAGEFALVALNAWKLAQGEGREFVFCEVRPGDHLAADKPLKPHAVYDIVKETERRTGIPFSPHDARRTFITEALATGMSIAEVQGQAGHANPSTTLGYAKRTDARNRRKNLRLRYGD